MFETATRESSEAAAIAAIRPVGEAAAAASGRLVAEGGSVVARETAQQEIAMALDSGMAVAVTQGVTNHSVLYIKNAAGKIVRIHGGPSRLLYKVVERNMDKAYGVGRHVHAYAAIELDMAAVPIEQAVEQVRVGGSAAARWIHGSPTSCGIVQGAVLEAVAPSADLARYIPQLASERLIPITILEHQMATGTGRIVEGGKFWIATGTAVTSLGMLGAAVIPAGVSTMVRVALPGMLEDGTVPVPDDEPLGDPENPPSPGGRPASGPPPPSETPGASESQSTPSSSTPAP